MTSVQKGADIRARCRGERATRRGPERAVRRPWLGWADASAVAVGAGVRIGLGPQLIRDLLLRARRGRLVLLERGHGRLPGPGGRLVVRNFGSIGHDDASLAVACAVRIRTSAPAAQARASDGSTHVNE